MKLSVSMGGDASRFERDTQEAARLEIGKSLKACISDGGVKADCLAVAKEQFESFGGDPGQFEQGKRLGAGAEASKALKACVTEAVDKAAAGACIDSACEVQAEAGGEANDCWFDRKQGLLRWTLQEYVVCTKDEAGDCDTKAKTFFTDALNGEASDWNDDDWATFKANAGKKILMRLAKSVDGRFQIGIDGQTSTQTKAAIDRKKTSIKNGIKAAVQATVVDCSDASDATSPTDANIACRMTFDDEAAASAAEQTLRNGQVDSAVITALGARRLGASRRLSTSVTKSEGSHVQEEASEDSPTPTPSPTPPSPSPDPAPSPAPPSHSPDPTPSPAPPSPSPDPTPSPTPESSSPDPSP